MLRNISVLWLVAVSCAIFLIVPPVDGLGNSVKIAFFHVPLAWVSVLGFLLSAYWGFRYLETGEIKYDLKSSTSAKLGFLFCMLATLSGMLFAKLTWGTYWNWDPRQTTIFIVLLLYGSYMTLRFALQNERQRGRISAVYSLLAFSTVPFLVFIIPRFYFSLHPEPIINRLARVEMDSVMIYILLLTVAIDTLLFWKLLCYKVKKEYEKYLGSLQMGIDKDGMEI